MKTIFTFALLALSISIFAQPNKNREEKIRSLRVAYISTKLDLNTDEAQKFWPIFNKFDNKQTEFLKQRRKIMFDIRKTESQNVPEAEIKKILQNSEQIEIQLQNNRTDFTKNLQGVIPTQKILLLKKIEEEFKQKMFFQIKERLKNRRNKL